MGHHNRQSRMIICEGCGVTVVTIGSRTRWCKECAKKQAKVYEARAREKRKREKPAVTESNVISFCDSPEAIQKCLSCKLPTCRNCLAYRKRA